MACQLIIGYQYLKGTYSLHLVGQQYAISLKACVSISSAVRISNLALK
jgi:hypothetical protein